MVNAKEKMTADFEKVKSAGGVRVDRIRQIFQDALTQTVTELKQGTHEIGSIAKESTSTLVEGLKDNQKNAKPETVIPVEVEIQGDDKVNEVVKSESTEDIKEVPADFELIQPELIQPELIQPDAEQFNINVTDQPTPADQPSEEPTPSRDHTSVESFAASLKALAEQIMHSLQSGEAKAAVQPQIDKLKALLGILDTKLAAQYGERYDAFKQEFNQDMGKAKTWYDHLRADADAQGMNFFEYKQAELVIKMGEAGVAIAQKETKIKQLVKELWQTVTQF